MAILKELPGVQVTIFANGSDLQEHTCVKPEPAKRTVDRLVEASSNQAFEVRWNVAQTDSFKGTDLCFKVYVDGEAVSSHLLGKMDVKNGTMSGGSKGLRVATDMKYNYQFTDVEIMAYESSSLSSRTPSRATSMIRQDIIFTPATTATRAVTSATSHRPVSNMEELGTIKVEVTHKKRLYQEPFKARHTGFSINMDNKKSAARENAMSHVITLSAPEKTRVSEERWVTEHLKGSRQPVATYIFHYRSSRILQSILDPNSSIIEEASEESSYHRAVLTESALATNEANRGRHMHRPSQHPIGVPPTALASRLQDLAISRQDEPVDAFSVTSYSGSQVAARIFTPSSTANFRNARSM